MRIKRAENTSTDGFMLELHEIFNQDRSTGQTGKPDRVGINTRLNLKMKELRAVVPKNDRMLMHR
jgi:hypothetical protein